MLAPRLKQESMHPAGKTGRVLVLGDADYWMARSLQERCRGL